MKKAILVLFLFVCCILLFSCSGAQSQLNSTEEHRLLDLYRSSSAIAYAKCTGISETGNYAVIKTEKVLCGSISDEFYYEGNAVASGSEYLFFLKSADTHFNDESCSYMAVSKEAVHWNGSYYTKSIIDSSINSFSDVISMPAHTYFYDTRSSLLSSCSDIIIGKLSSASKAEERSVYQTTDATSVERKMKCASPTVSVISTLRGNIQSGSTIQIVFSSESVSSMTDISTLSTISMQRNDVAELENGKFYIFFLNASTDPKQDFYFPVNPIQGWIYLKKDAISAADKNTLFEDCTQLKTFVGELNNVSKQTQNQHGENTSTDGQ